MQCKVHKKSIQFYCTNSTCVLSKSWKLCSQCISKHITHCKEITLKTNLSSKIQQLDIQKQFMILAQTLLIKNENLRTLLDQLLVQTESIILKWQKLNEQNNFQQLFQFMYRSIQIQCDFQKKYLQLHFKRIRLVDNLSKSYQQLQALIINKLGHLTNSLMRGPVRTICRASSWDRSLKSKDQIDSITLKTETQIQLLGVVLCEIQSCQQQKLDLKIKLLQQGRLVHQQFCQTFAPSLQPIQVHFNKFITLTPNSLYDLVLQRSANCLIKTISDVQDTAQVNFQKNWLDCGMSDKNRGQFVGVLVL